MPYLTEQELLDVSPLVKPTLININASMHGSREMAAREDSPSRLKYRIHHTTDFDYVAQDNEFNHNILKQDGFLKVDNKYFLNPSSLFVACYTKTFHDRYYPCEVQIILLKDKMTYIDVWDSIDPNFYATYLWKSGSNKPDKAQISAIMKQLIKTYNTI